MLVGCPPIEPDSSILTQSTGYDNEGDVYQIGRQLRAPPQNISVLEAFLLAMALNPDVCKTGQKVIDEQIGTDRLI